MKRRKLKPYDQLISMVIKAMDVICKNSSGVTKAFNILLQFLLSIFTASIMNRDLLKEALNNQMLMNQVLLLKQKTFIWSSIAGLLWSNIFSSIIKSFYFHFTLNKSSYLLLCCDFSQSLEVDCFFSSFFESWVNFSRCT